jgi:prepilin-type N-terminal cleavage/methylation domain-containing protein
MKRSAVTQSRGRRRGFTLVEVLISVAVLLTVLALVFQQISAMQKMSASEASKLDVTQQAREFLNQTVRDLHMSGYPGPSMFASQPALGDPSVAAGLVSATPTEIQFEGDVNGEGQVYSVDISYVSADANDPNCPCVRRSATPKVQPFSASAPIAATSYTEAAHLVPPGTAPGQSGQNIFEFFDRLGNPVDLSTGNDITTPQGLQNLGAVAAIKINLTLTTGQRDPVSNQPVTVALSSLARPKQ